MKFTAAYVLVVLIVCCSNIFAYNTKKRCYLRKDEESCLAVNVVNVIDGTNVDVSIKDLEHLGNFAVNLFGITGPSEENLRKIAKEHLSQLLKNKRLTLITKKGKDASGRLSGVLFAGKVKINKKMVQDGHASKNSKKRPKPLKKVTSKKKLVVKIKKPRGKPSKNKPSKSKIEIFQVKLSRVVDGDTVYVNNINSPDSPTIKVRMVGIDAPEMKQEFGVESKEKLVSIMDDLEDDSMELLVEGKDKYGRSLGILKSGDVDINKELIESGYAWCYRYTQCPSTYQQAMQDAQRQRKGLFIQENPVTPWDWRNKDNQ